LKQSLSQMVIIYITWQGMFQNGHSSYDPNAYEYVSSMNPNVLDASNKRKVVRWFLERRCLFPQVSTRISNMLILQEVL
jgi:hypothetical protein